MADLGERGCGLAAHPLRRRVRCDELWMCSLECLELLNEFIVFGVRDVRIVEHVVPVVLTSYFGSQFRNARCDIRLHELAPVPRAYSIVCIVMEASGPTRSWRRVATPRS